MIAVIETGGKQYLVKVGSVLKVEKLDINEGEEVTFDKVYLLANEEGGDVKVGTPIVEGAIVKATVEENGRSKKVRVVKYKRKIRYKKVFGHRQHFTKIKITEIA
ncbi:MAG: 50S ribosomal protein L21 [Candidatus Magasanikbacteria bacterium]|nr:50S ribosomal protein L21 [Candidatus Magasanikbacteria bacterium]